MPQQCCRKAQHDYYDHRWTREDHVHCGVIQGSHRNYLFRNWSGTLVQREAQDKERKDSVNEERTHGHRHSARSGGLRGTATQATVAEH